MTSLPTLPLFLLLTGCAGFATDEDVRNADADLSDAIAALEQRVTDAEARVASTEERLAEAEAELLAQDEADAALDERVTGLEDDVGDLDGRVAVLEEHASEVDGRLDGLDASVDSLDAAVADLDTVVSDLDAATAASLDDLEARIGTNEDGLAAATTAITQAEFDLASLESAMLDEADRVDGELADLSDSITQLQDGLVFLGANDASFSLEIGNSEDTASSAFDDSSQASYGSVLVGAGTMEATGFQVPDLDDGLHEVSLAFLWGAGVNGESLTQRFTLECTGSTVLYAPRITVTTGDADSQGINVATPLRVWAWIDAASGDTLSCELHKEITLIAQGGSGILYNDISAPFIARVELEQPQ